MAYLGATIALNTGTGGVFGSATRALIQRAYQRAPTTTTTYTAAPVSSPLPVLRTPTTFAPRPTTTVKPVTTTTVKPAPVSTPTPKPSTSVAPKPQTPVSGGSGITSFAPAPEGSVITERSDMVTALTKSPLPLIGIALVALLLLNRR